MAFFKKCLHSTVPTQEKVSFTHTILRIYFSRCKLHQFIRKYFYILILKGGILNIFINSLKLSLVLSTANELFPLYCCQHFISFSCLIELNRSFTPALKVSMEPGMVVHTYNTRHLKGRDRRISSWRLAQATLIISYLKAK